MKDSPRHKPAAQASVHQMGFLEEVLGWSGEVLVVGREEVSRWSRAWLTWLQAPAPPQVAPWLWARDLTSVSPHFLICRWEGSGKEPTGVGPQQVC